MQSSNAAIFKNNVLFRLKLRSFGNRRKGELSDEAVAKIIGAASPMELPEEYAKRLQDAKKRLKLGKSLIDAEEFDAIKTFLADVRDNLLSLYCNPSFIDEGWYCVRMDVVKKVEETIRAAEAQLNEKLVPAFLAVYPGKIEQARAIFNGQFNASDYPSEVDMSRMFGIAYRWVQLDIPEGLPPEIREQEEKKLRDTYAQAEQAIVGALWSELQKITEHVVDRLQPGEDGKRKKFNDSLFDNLTTFITAFSNRNAFNDTRLASLVEQAQGILKGVGGVDPGEAATRMRDFELMRDKTAQAFAAVKAEIDKTIETLPGRSFSFEE